MVRTLSKAGVCCLCILTLTIVSSGPTAGTVRAQEATPIASKAAGPLADLLRLSPDIPSSPDEQGDQIASFADLALQTEVSGVPRPTNLDSQEFVNWGFALSPLLLPSDFVQYAMVADWATLTGFSMLDIDQSLEVGLPPGTLRFFRGRFDRAKIEAVWAAQGYTMLEVDGITVASLRADAGFDISSDFGRYFFSHLNNAAFLPDGTLAFAPTLDGMKAIIATTMGKAPSLADRVDIAVLLSTIQEPWATATIVPGGAFHGVDPALLLGATPDALTTAIAAASAMPPITTALLGVTPGGPLSRPQFQDATPQPDIPPATFQIALLLPSRPLAETAAKVVIDRLATMSSQQARRPYSDFFATRSADVDPDYPIALIHLDFAPGIQPRIWFNMYVSRDLGFLVW